MTDSAKPGLSAMGTVRFFRSEVGMVFRRRRNLVMLLALGLVPVLISVAVKVGRHGDRGGSIFGSVTANGLFAAFAAFLVAVPLLLPLVVAVVAGDALAGEANIGTLRYLLVVPVGRSRLLLVKFASVLVWGAACVLVIAVVGAAVGTLVFPAGKVTLLSGSTVSYGAGLVRLLGVSGYLTAMAAGVGAIGVFLSTMTEVPVAAMAATLTVTIVGEVADEVPQFDVIHGWLPSHYWLQWVDLLRAPVVTEAMVTGLLVTLGYAALFLAMAWARFSGSDVTA